MTNAEQETGIAVIDLKDLPTLNACLNGISTVLLLSGYYFIRSNNRDAHRLSMLLAVGTSAIFLVSYLIYHYNVGSVRFTGEGNVRIVYFSILISHTILAAAVPVLACLSVVRAFKKQFGRHKRIARWTLPIWLYVSVTGVVIYLMLYVFYRPA